MLKNYMVPAVFILEIHIVVHCEGGNPLRKIFCGQERYGTDSFVLLELSFMSKSVYSTKEFVLYRSCPRKIFRSGFPA